jgi:hypothetical protein
MLAGIRAFGLCAQRVSKPAALGNNAQESRQRSKTPLGAQTGKSGKSGKSVFLFWRQLLDKRAGYRMIPPSSFGAAGDSKG